MRVHVVGLLGLATFLVSCELAFGIDAVAQSAQRLTSETARGVILQQSEGERRTRRTRPTSGIPLAAPGMIIKVDRHNGGSSNFFMGYEEIAPGAAIPAHSHPDYDE